MLREPKVDYSTVGVFWCGPIALPDLGRIRIVRLETSNEYTMKDGKLERQLTRVEGQT
jgi:hypothetical protein